MQDLVAELKLRSEAEVSSFRKEIERMTNEYDEEVQKASRLQNEVDSLKKVSGRETCAYDRMPSFPLRGFASWKATSPSDRSSTTTLLAGSTERRGTHPLARSWRRKRRRSGRPKRLCAKRNQTPHECSTSLTSRPRRFDVSRTA